MTTVAALQDGRDGKAALVMTPGVRPSPHVILSFFNFFPKPSRALPA